MRESSSPVTIAQSIDARHVGLELTIHLDITALIHCDAGVFQTEVSRVRHAADREKQIRADDCLVVATAFEIDSNFGTVFCCSDAFSVKSDIDAFILEDFFDGFRNVFVFALNQPRPHLDDRDPTAKAAIHLTKLQPHITAADDYQVLRQVIYIHHA